MWLHRSHELCQFYITMLCCRSFLFLFFPALLPWQSSTRHSMWLQLNAAMLQEIGCEEVRRSGLIVFFSFLGSGSIETCRTRRRRWRRGMMWCWPTVFIWLATFAFPSNCCVSRLSVCFYSNQQLFFDLFFSSSSFYIFYSQLRWGGRERESWRREEESIAFVQMLMMGKMIGSNFGVVIISANYCYCFYC